jgi:hypothetical protein
MLAAHFNLAAKLACDTTHTTGVSNLDLRLVVGIKIIIACGLSVSPGSGPEKLMPHFLPRGQY